VREEKSDEGGIIGKRERGWRRNGLGLAACRKWQTYGRSAGTVEATTLTHKAESGA